MKSILRRLLSSSSSSANRSAPARDEERGPGADPGHLSSDESMVASSTSIAALAATLSSMGERTGLTLADVAPSPPIDKGPSWSAAPPSGAGEMAEPEAEADAAMEDGDEPPPPPPIRMTATMSMSFCPWEAEPEWALFQPFDELMFSFLGGCIGVSRPIPKEVCARTCIGAVMCVFSM